MKSFIKAFALVGLIAAPLVSFAQSNQQPVTRAQVRAELAQLRQAGYNPNDWVNYPANIQSAEAVVAQRNDTAYGAGTGSTSQSGAK